MGIKEGNIKKVRYDTGTKVTPFGAFLNSAAGVGQGYLKGFVDQRTQEAEGVKSILPAIIQTKAFKPSTKEQGGIRIPGTKQYIQPSAPGTTPSEQVNLNKNKLFDWRYGGGEVPAAASRGMAQEDVDNRLLYDQNYQQLSRQAAKEPSPENLQRMANYRNNLITVAAGEVTAEVPGQIVPEKSQRSKRKGFFGPTLIKPYGMPQSDWEMLSDKGKIQILEAWGLID